MHREQLKVLQGTVKAQLAHVQVLCLSVNKLADIYGKSFQVSLI